MVCVMITIIVFISTHNMMDLMEGVAFKCIQVSGRKTTTTKNKEKKIYRTKKLKS